MLGAGVVGAALTGWFLDKTSAYKKLLVFLQGFSFIIFGGLSYFVIVQKSFIGTLSMIVPLGMSMISAMPDSLGLGIELTFPL